MKKGSKMTKAQRAAHSKRIKAAWAKKRRTRERKPADPVAEAVASLVAAVRKQEVARMLAKLSEA